MKEKKQLGGTMNNLEELLKVFLQFLVLDAAAQGVLIQSEQDLQSYAELLGEEGIKAKYLQFMQMMQGNSVKALLGSKLTYYKKLKGICPEGQEVSYFEVGGRVCKVCKLIAKDKSAKEGKKLNIVLKFKLDRELKKSKNLKK